MSNYDEIQYLHSRIDVLEQANDILIGTLHDLVEHINQMNDTHYILYNSAPPRLELQSIYLEPEDELDDD